MLIIENLTKVYDKNKVAVDNLSLRVETGEIFGFIGHNGAGKTTTIKAIVGIINFIGDVTLNGVSIKSNPIEFKKMVAYIPDSPEIYDNLTGIQYLNFISNIYDISSERRIELIKKYSSEFELLDVLNDQIKTYSHGMKQKLVLVSAFIREPKLLILDEPFVGLDPKASFKMKELMIEMAEKGSIIFFSTHVLEVAEKFCNTVGIIKKSKLVKKGTMSEVRGDKSLENIFLELLDNE
ncbi:ABC transporter ATP-binding protein [Haploplasma modicum]|uniref:ABC transporter ATP-binding protein n=1 Tax=Haploplasma modicum TaxID=2150 RepID=UPI00214B74E0|nr:ABC transporter ATP-binding protein [Haploplasma modicum]MCR1808725.1 ABC transporter ATP-binding protein [Haploplasma modicum]